MAEAVDKTFLGGTSAQICSPEMCITGLSNQAKTTSCKRTNFEANQGFKFI